MDEVGKISWKAHYYRFETRMPKKYMLTLGIKIRVGQDDPVLRALCISVG